MDLRTGTFTAIAAIALCVLTLSGVRAGCEVGLSHDRQQSKAQDAWQPCQDAVPRALHDDSLPASGFMDRAGAGLDTGMPYYSFASRRISL